MQLPLALLPQAHQAPDLVDALVNRKRLLHRDSDGPDNLRQVLIFLIESNKGRPLHVETVVWATQVFTRAYFFQLLFVVAQRVEADALVKRKCSRQDNLALLLLSPHVCSTHLVQVGQKEKLVGHADRSSKQASHARAILTITRPIVPFC